MLMTGPLTAVARVAVVPDSVTVSAEAQVAKAKNAATMPAMPATPDAREHLRLTPEKGTMQGTGVNLDFTEWIICNRL